MNTSSAKPVIMTDPSGVETEYPSQAAAKVASGLSQTSISNMCNGFGPKTVKGWAARFKLQSQPTAPTRADLEAGV